jgi:hypothetical protein
MLVITTRFGTFGEAQMAVLRLSHPHLISLTIFEPYTELDESPSNAPNQSDLASTTRKYFDFYEVMLEEDLQFPRLRALRVALGDNHEVRELCELLKAMPVLGSLGVEASTNERRFPEISSEDVAGIPQLLGLSYLAIEVMSNDFVDLLVGILSKAPNLKHLAMNGRWDPVDASYGMKAIREHHGLEIVSWFGPMRRCASGLFNGQTRPNLTTLVESRQDLGEAKESLLNVSLLRTYNRRRPAQRLCLQAELRIPIATKIKKYVVLRGARPSSSEYAMIGVQPCSEENWVEEEGVLPEIQPWFALSFRRAPDLTEIHFGPDHEGLLTEQNERNRLLDGAPETYDTWGRFKSTTPPRDWETTGDRGAIIRTFSRPDDQSRELIHVRVLSRSVMDAGMRPLVGPLRKWSTLSYYRGHPISPSVLAEAYGLADLPCAFMEGGRNLTLTDGAWQVLDTYADQLNKLRGISLETEREQYDFNCRIVPDADLHNSSWSDHGRGDMEEPTYYEGGFTETDSDFSGFEYQDDFHGYGSDYPL